MEDEQETSEYLKLGQKIPTSEKFYFGIGVLANTILTGIVALYLTDYYLNEMKIRYELFIIANVIFLFYNALNDVFFGFYADRTKHRLGRRIPYIRYGAPIFAIAFIYFWFPLPGSNPGDLYSGQMIKFFQLLTAYLFFDTMLTIVILSIVALPPEMSESTEERTSIALYNTIFAAVGGVVILVVPIIMSLGLDIFRIFILIMAGVSTIAYLILSYGIKERKELHKPSADLENMNILKEIGQTFRNKTFITFLIFNFCIVYMNIMALSFTPFFCNIFGLEGESSTILLLNFYLGFLIGMPAYLYLGKKIAIRTIIIGIAIICFIGIFILFLTDLLFNLTEVYRAIIVLDGILAGMALFYYPYISDSIDIDELNTGRRREGMHFGINALITKPAEELPKIVGVSILLITGYVQGGSAARQPISAINGLKFMLAVIPMLFIILIIFSQIINPLKGDYLKEMKRNLITLHEQKKAENK